MVFINLVNAQETSNLKKEFTKDSKSGTIKLNDCSGIWNGINCMLGTEILTKTKVAEYKLTDNTDKCWEDCSFKGDAILYTSGKLFDDIRFENLNTKASESIQFKHYILTNQSYDIDVPVLKEVCYDEKNIPKEFIIFMPETELTKGKKCHMPVDYYIKQSVENWDWTEYKDEILPPGNYTFMGEGKKNPKDSLDWIVTSRGKEFTEWTNWTTADCSATGGTITIDGDYCVVKFTANGTLNVTQTINASVLLVAGGGSGGTCGGGGGGAGGIIYNSSYILSTGFMNVTVGSGGQGLNGGNCVNNVGNNGTNSTFGLLSARGGGQGGNGNPTIRNGSVGGSGGGASYSLSYGGLGTILQGNNGSAANGGAGGTGGNRSGGGGGGNSAAPAGAGGAGGNSTINGSLVTYGGGGGGACGNGGCSGGAGGVGGGGAGGLSAAGTNGTNGLGGGGGGAWLTIEGSGGSGVVIIRYLAGITVSDTSYPQFTNSLTNPSNNSEYSPNAKYNLNITITNTNSSAGIEFNGINYTMSNLSSVFNKTLNDLSEGTYSYYFWAYGNGTLHNYNNSINYSYTVAKNSSLTLTISGTTPITYPTATDVGGSNCPSQLTCAIDKINATYGAGTVTFNYSTSGNANYTSTSITKTITINKATTTLTLTPTTPITYGTSTDFNTNKGGCPAGETCNLNITDGVFGAGTVSANYSFVGNDNYTASSAVATVTINKANSQTSLTFDKETPQTYPTPITPTCSLLIGLGSVSLTNGTSGVPEILGVGTWTINCSYAGNTNYTSSSNTTNYVITQNNTYTLGITKTSPINYGTTTDFTGTGCPSQLTCSLNLTNAIFGAGVVYANYSTNGNNNYSSNSVVDSITINKINSSVYTYLNNSRSNISILNGSSIWLNGTKQTGEGIIKLYNQGTLINQGNLLSNFTIFNTAGSFNITTIYESTDNYTSSYETFFVNVSNTVCPPNFQNTSWSDWTDVGCIGLTGDMNQSRFLVQYDQNQCGSPNQTIYEYRSIYNSSCPVPDVNQPNFTNCRNLTGYTNTSFSKSITATDDVGISSYWLNDTSNFIVSNSGLITNNTFISTPSLFYLNLSVNDTSNNMNSCIFWINITNRPVTPTGTGNLCRYKKFGFYNDNIKYFKEINCI
jgi:hypothetical protein